MPNLHSGSTDYLVAYSCNSSSGVVFPFWGTMLPVRGMLALSPSNSNECMDRRTVLGSKLGRWKCDLLVSQS